MLAVGATTCGVPPVLRTAALDALVARAACADPRALVLILGEPGVGKDVLARLVHTDSARHLYPFIKVSCALEPVDRCEAELFGVERRASSPAIRRRLGALEFANHGTIYLDNLELLPPVTVTRLLQALKGGEVSRVGAGSICPVDLRVIASSAVDCVELRGLDTVQITIPPLRQRPDEICSFASFFVEQFNRRYRRRPTCAPPRSQSSETIPGQGTCASSRKRCGVSWSAEVTGSSNRESHPSAQGRTGPAVASRSQLANP